MLSQTTDLFKVSNTYFVGQQLSRLSSLYLEIPRIETGMFCVQSRCTAIKP